MCPLSKRRSGICAAVSSCFPYYSDTWTFGIEKREGKTLAQLNFDEYYESRPRWVRWVDKQKTGFVQSFFKGKEALKVLDWGCGNGDISSTLCPTHEVYGLDMDEAALKRAARKGLKVLKGDLSTIPYPEAFFDVVLMTDVIEHVPSREQSFSEIRRVLKPSGSYLSITPRYDSAAWVLGEKFMWFMQKRRNSGHISPFTEESLRFFMEKNFSHLRLETLNMGMWLAALAQGPKEIRTLDVRP